MSINSVTHFLGSTGQPESSPTSAQGVDDTHSHESSPRTLQIYAAELLNRAKDIHDDSTAALFNATNVSPTETGSYYISIFQSAINNAELAFIGAETVALHAVSGAKAAAAARSTGDIESARQFTEIARTFRDAAYHFEVASHNNLQVIEKSAERGRSVLTPDQQQLSDAVCVSARQYQQDASAVLTVSARAVSAATTDGVDWTVSELTVKTRSTVPVKGTAFQRLLRAQLARQENVSADSDTAIHSGRYGRGSDTSVDELRSEAGSATNDTMDTSSRSSGSLIFDIS